ncbi:glycine cleavage system protein T [Jannaschia pagri]|uniref:Glycine cleavage system protein T n=1 Tax=Jannaschia pagri TaxID=2829797 RepID=A0ABQ4NNG7_9RHOB|nr:MULTISPECIES: FAD-dependent oxidoreductase [unclassified Jannaschia]GIT92122.1 glycine cleavage system protein T [Jannaschia sp. AI_61]GIT95957.1 glycine cleavage system protein T [Jannaschia sp. AI_62]
MQETARVVVIGGGVVGCSVLYHLAKGGWTDVLLLERSELTSGSTWHAAGGCHTINGDPNVAKLQKYTIELYKEIEELSGQATGFHMTGGVLLASTPDRFDWLKTTAAAARMNGIEAEVISPTEAADAFPLMDPTKFVGAVRTHVDGHLDPSGVTYAYAKSARKLGAKIETHTKVTGIARRGDGWVVQTDKGDVICEHVVNAGGLWAREVGRMVGLELPVLAMEHMYLLTEDMPEVAQINAETGREVIHAVDFDGELYLRQERGGMLMGTYERACVPWSERETPWDFGHELLQPDIDRIAPSLEVGFEHFPAFQTAGIKQIINGPFTFAPDGNPLVGPIRGLPGMWSACGVMAGFSQGGGVGLSLANWIIDGDPGFDVWAMDVARYGDWATLSYTNPKVQENYARRFSIRFPNEELPAARPHKTTPIYDRMLGLGAQMGDSWGLETPLWFSPDDTRDVFSWRRSTDFAHVANEVRACREGVGLMETSGFSKFLVRGPGARAYLDRVFACKIPAVGRMALAPMLKEDGKIQGDLTISCLPMPAGGEEFLLVGSGMAEVFYARWFDRFLPDDGSVTVEVLGLGLLGLSVAGPKSRAVMEAVTGQDMSNAAHRFMAVRRMDVGLAPAIVGRVSFTGDLGYEIWMKPEYQRSLFDALMASGAAHGIKPFGLRALNAMRLEKSYGGWGTEFRPLYGPVEAGLDRFVAYTKATEFVGKEAAVSERATGGTKRLCSFVVEAVDADVMHDEPIWLGDERVGYVTSGGFAHHAGVSMALGYVDKAHANADGPWTVELLGERLPMRPQPVALFDANGARQRG